VIVLSAFWKFDLLDLVIGCYLANTKLSASGMQNKVTAKQPPV
jgi:hypothetical protein